jgi:hypothetical protein
MKEYGKLWGPILTNKVRRKRQNDRNCGAES